MSAIGTIIGESNGVTLSDFKAFLSGFMETKPDSKLARIGPLTMDGWRQYATGEKTFKYPGNSHQRIVRRTRCRRTFRQLWDACGNPSKESLVAQIEENWNENGAKMGWEKSL